MSVVLEMIGYKVLTKDIPEYKERQNNDWEDLKKLGFTNIDFQDYIYPIEHENAVIIGVAVYREPLNKKEEKLQKLDLVVMRQDLAYMEYLAKILYQSVMKINEPYIEEPSFYRFHEN